MLGAFLDTIFAGVIPVQLLILKLDFLLFRAKKNGVSTDVMNAFPWISWYIWKACNEKILKNKEISPMDTLQLAVKEAESWLLTQRV